MKKSNLVRLTVLFLSVFLCVHLWLKFLNAMEPEPHDGEPEGEFDPDLPFAQPGDILLFNRAKGLNRIITWFTNSPFYHVGISLGEGRVVEARPRGVVIRNLLGKEGDKRFEIIPAENIGGREAALAAMKWAQTQVGDGYDPFNVAAIILDRSFSCIACNTTLPGRWACGEFVATAFEEAGVELFPEHDIAIVVPADYAPFLRKVPQTATGATQLNSSRHDFDD